MGILYWDKPEKVMSSEQWSQISADGAPPGVFTPNMSREDMFKWKAKLVGVNVGHPTIEIRKSTIGATQVLIIVSLGGFREKHWKTGEHIIQLPEFNIKVSQNGSAYYSWQDLNDMNQAVEEAKQVLLQLRPDKVIN